MCPINVQGVSTATAKGKAVVAKALSTDAKMINATWVEKSGKKSLPASKKINNQNMDTFEKVKKNKSCDPYFSCNDICY